MDYIQTSMKLIIGIIYAILIMRLSGRKTLSPLSSFDQINNYILGGIIGGVLFNKNIEIKEFIFVLTLWGILTLVINFLRKKSNIVKRWIDGEPITLIEKGKIKRKGIEKANISVQDLYLKLKIQGIYDISFVELATLEQNGSLIAFKKADMNLQAIPLVIDKMIYQENLDLLGHDERWLKAQLAEKGISNLDEIASVEYYKDNIRIIDFN